MPEGEVTIGDCRLWLVIASDGEQEVRLVDEDNQRWTFRKAVDSNILVFAPDFGKHDREDWHIWMQDDDLTTTIIEQFFRG